MWYSCENCQIHQGNSEWKQPTVDPRTLTKLFSQIILLISNKGSEHQISQKKNQLQDL
jgi:hypothetical protein